MDDNDDNVIRFPSNYRPLPAELALEATMTPDERMMRQLHLMRRALTAFLTAVADGCSPRGTKRHRATAAIALLRMAVGYAYQQWPEDKAAREQFCEDVSKALVLAKDLGDGDALDW